MNTIIYKLLNKINKSRILEDIYLDNLYQFYIDESKIRNCEVNICESDFKKFFCIIYDVLGLRISSEEFEMISYGYLKLLIVDAIDGNKVDLRWFIKYIWYLNVCINDEVCTEKYEDCILFIQEKLIKEFNINENIKEKIGKSLSK